MRNLSRSLVAAVLVVASPVAQHSWLPLGSQIANGSTAEELVTVSLGFSFTMPGSGGGGQVVVDRYGRILEVNPAGNTSSGGTPTVMAGSASQPTLFGSIHAFGEWFDYADPAARVWLYGDGGTVAAITWTNMTASNASGSPCTFQAQLYADGRIVLLYDSNCVANGQALVGVCPGSGVALPPETDLLAATSAGPFVTADPTVYSWASFNLAGRALEFVPNGVGGAAGWTVNGSSSGPDPIYARNRTRAAGCFVPTSYTFVPDGVGGYDVTSGPSQYDPNVGALAGATADDVITAIGLDLGFPMLFPDGSLHQLVDIDPNGRIVPTGAAGTFGVPAINVSQVTASGYPAFFGMWSNWDVEAPTSDGIYFRTDPGSATFTWRDVSQSWGVYSLGSGETPPCTWQIRLEQGGTVVVTHQDLAGMNLPDVPVPDAAVGMTTGVGPDPGETDLSMLSSTPLNVAGYVYEHWDCSVSSSSTAPPAEPVDLLIETPRLVGLTRPAVGTNWELQVQRVGAATFGFYVVGLAPANASLVPFGSPCTRAVSLDLTQLRLADGLGDLQPWGVSIPNNPALSGLALYAQGVAEQPVGGSFSGFLGLPFALTWSNAVRGTLGQE